ncbi:Hypothetical predicted protein [Octopus vulgaris]|uniref:Uncharacterized protein n=2 Tax=Octopus TaxID=6643 RepID=A0AA36FH71_OCTVU|nr:protein FAM124A-like [Octopus sinensis]CAI9736999.1 Hypothetical predicted protein [Octopus vulgaris]
MNPYILRTYGLGPKQNTCNYPLWDYRSQRYSSIGSSSDGASLNSSKGSSSRSDSSSEAASIITTEIYESFLPFEVKIFADSSQINMLNTLYRPLINLLDSDLHIIKISDNRSPRCSETNSLKKQDYLRHVFVPSFSILIFLLEDGLLTQQRFSEAQFYFQQKPWKFYHRSRIDKRKAIEFCSDNMQEFYGTSKGYPLWGIRRVHYGKEHLRFMLFVSCDNWLAMVSFYKVLMNSAPEYEQDDFCMFTVDNQEHYDVQFVLKQLPPHIIPEPLYFVELEFQISDIGILMPHFPNVCKPMSGHKWCTSDHDGNPLIMSLKPRLQCSPQTSMKRNSPEYLSAANKVFFV